MVEFLNPDTIHSPVGAYAHTVVVPAGTALVFISGQVGMRRDGSIPSTLSEQVEVAFENLRACLAAHGLGMESVVKLTSFVVAGQDLSTVREIRRRHLSEHRPTSTVVYVPALVSPSFLLEVEAVAVKSATEAGRES